MGKTVLCVTAFILAVSAPEAGAAVLSRLGADGAAFEGVAFQSAGLLGSGTADTVVLALATLAVLGIGALLRGPS